MVIQRQFKSNGWSGRKAVLLFLASYATLWTLVPWFSNAGLPSDTIEEVAWGREWLLGIYRHPPMMLWPLEVIWKFTGGWLASPYLLSGLFFGAGLYCIYELLRLVRPAEQAAFTVFMTPLVYFFGPQLPQWNANTAQLLFAGLFLYTAWRGVMERSLAFTLLAGLAAGGGLLAKYSFALLPFFSAVGMIINKTSRARIIPTHILAAFVVAVLAFLPHVWWYFHAPVNTLDYITMSAEKAEGSTLWGHVLSPIALIGESAVLLLPMIIFIRYGLSSHTRKIATTDPAIDQAAKVFLGFSVLGPIFFTAFVGLYGGAFIKDQWLYAFFLAAPSFVTLVMLPADRHIEILRRSWIWLGVLLLVLAAAYPLERELHYMRSRDRADFWVPLMPAEPLRDVALAAWSEAIKERGLPEELPQIIAGGTEAAGIANTSPHRPAWLEHFDIGLSPWVSGSDIAKFGVIATEALPEGFDTRYRLCVAKAIDYTWLNGRGRMGRVVPVRILLPEGKCLKQ